MTLVVFIILTILFQFASFTISTEETIQLLQIKQDIKNGIFLRNLADDSITLSSESKIHTQGVVGWLSAVYSYDSTCSQNTYLESFGFLTSQCLFSLKYQIYFYISCGSASAVLSLYSDNKCMFIVHSQSYTLNSCRNLQQPIVSSLQYTCSSTIQPATVPNNRDIMQYTYYTDSTCQIPVQYSAFAESICIPFKGNQYAKYVYPRQVIYSDRLCNRQLSVLSPTVDSCQDWVSIYGYSTDDGLNAYAPYWIISERSSSSRSSRPSASPTMKPSPSPTISSAPSNTGAPSTASPTRTNSPTAAPSVSLAPTKTPVPTLMPSKAPIRKPTVRPSVMIRSPTASPSTPEDGSIFYYVLQVMEGPECNALISKSGKRVLVATVNSLLTDDPSTTLLALTDITCFLVTTTADQSSSSASSSLVSTTHLSYTLTIPSTLAMGYVSPALAYNSTTWQLSTAVSAGDFRTQWQSAVSTNSERSLVSTLVNASCSSISFSDMFTASSSPSSSPSTKKHSSTSQRIIVIIALTLIGIVAFPLLSYCGVIILRKVVNRYIAKPHISPEVDDIELADARIVGSVELQQFQLHQRAIPTAVPVVGEPVVARPVPVPVPAFST